MSKESLTDQQQQPHDERGVSSTAVATQAGIAKTSVAVQRADSASKVAGTLVDIASSKRVPAAKQDLSAFLRDEATRAKTLTGTSGKTGQRARLKGHLFEDLDIESYNAKGHTSRKSLKQRNDPRQQAYDADRFIEGKYAGSVQHKSSSAGASTAVAKMEKKKPGSARYGTIRVPADQFDETRKRARGRARVAASDVTTEQLEDTLSSGLDALAKNGTKAASKRRAVTQGAVRAGVVSAAIGGATEAAALVRGDVDAKTFAKRRAQEAGEAAVATTVGTAAKKLGKATAGGRAVAQGAARSAAVTVTVSSVRDVPALLRGDLSGRDFAENRGVDAVEAAAATALGTVATGAVLATTGGAAAATAVGGAAATAAASAALAAAGTGTLAGTAVAGVLGGVTATVAGPAIVGGAVVVGTGLVVGKGFKVVRRRVKAHQERRRTPDPLTSASLGAQPVPDVEVILMLDGKNVFTTAERDEIVACLEQLQQDELTRQRASRRLHCLGFPDQRLVDGRCALRFGRR